MGFCAPLNKPMVHKAIPFAEKYIDAKEGLAIASSADLFLGDLGAISREDAREVFPFLERSMANVIFNEQDWLLEALFKVFKNLGHPERTLVLKFAQYWKGSTRKTTQQRAKKLLGLRKG